MHASDLEAVKKSPAGAGPPRRCRAGQAGLRDLASPSVRWQWHGRRAHADTGEAGAGVAGSTLERAPAPAQADRIILQSIRHVYRGLNIY